MTAQAAARPAGRAGCAHPLPPAAALPAAAAADPPPPAPAAVPRQLPAVPARPHLQLSPPLPPQHRPLPPHPPAAPALRVLQALPSTSQPLHRPRCQHALLLWGLGKLDLLCPRRLLPAQRAGLLSGAPAPGSAHQASAVAKKAWKGAVNGWTGLTACAAARSARILSMRSCLQRWLLLPVAAPRLQQSTCSRCGACPSPLRPGPPCLELRPRALLH